MGTAVVGGAVAAVKSYKETGKVDVKKTLTSAAKGAVIGGAVGLTLGIATVAIAGAGIAASTDTVMGTVAGKLLATAAVTATVTTSFQQGAKVGSGQKVTVASVAVDTAKNYTTSLAAVTPVANVALGLYSTYSQVNSAVEAVRKDRYGDAAWHTALAVLSGVGTVGATKMTSQVVNEYFASPQCAAKAATTSTANTSESAGKASNDIVGTNYSEIKPTQDIVNPQKVADYSQQLQAGEKLPPVEVVEIPGKGTYIIEGHHRYVASQQTGIPIEIKVVQGNGPVGMPDWSDVQWKEYISESQFWGD